MTNTNRPFDNFRLAISKPDYFFGRQKLLANVMRSPFQVRIILGGRRLGKTSTLNAIQWTLFNQNSRAFPVLFNLQQEQPESLDNFRYLLILRLQEALIQKQTKSSNTESRLGLRRTYRRLLRQFSGGEIGISGFKLNVTNPHQERRLIHEDFRQDLLKIIKHLQKHNLEGICFLLDGAEFIVRQEWANDAWSYLRGLKDTDTAINPFLGFCFSGYRDLKDYQQRVGSPLLNIADVEWLGTLTESDARSLIVQRSQNEGVPLTEMGVNTILDWAGYHPYLTQQLINEIFDDYQMGKSRSTESFMLHQQRKHDHDFSAWWDEDQRSYGFSQVEQTVYCTLIQQREGTAETVAEQAQFSFGQVADALEVLTGTGVIRQLDDERYRMGSKLFEEWVVRERR